MSLRGFHILLIFLATLCSGGFWAWAYCNADTARELHAMTAANFSGSLAIFLFFYGLWFAFVKSKTIRVS
jgi:hypothetical protein